MRTHLIGRGSVALVVGLGEILDAVLTRAVPKTGVPLTETIEGLLSTPRPKTADARKLVGEWRGSMWMNPEDKNESLLRIRDSAGVLVGEWINWPEPNMELVMPLQYIKLVTTGMEWGYMNGMRPRGLLLYEGKLDGDVLAGEMRFGGIRFVPPPGMPDKPARIYFELKRQASTPFGGKPQSPNR